MDSFSVYPLLCPRDHSDNKATIDWRTQQVPVQLGFRSPLRPSSFKSQLYYFSVSKNMRENRENASVTNGCYT